MARSDGTGVKAVGTSLDVVEAVAALDGAGVSEIARHLDKSKGGVYKHVRTLTDRGYLVRDGTTYRLGLRFWTLGTDVRDRLSSGEVESVVDDLTASIGHAVTLVAYRGGTAAVLYRQAPSGTTVASPAEGDSLPLHASAAGKAILAYLPEAERESVLEGGMSAFTDATRTDPDRIDGELEEVRRRRLAQDRGEYVAGIESIAAPIIGGDGYPRGAVAVTSAADQLLDGDFEADASLLVSASKSLENASPE